MQSVSPKGRLRLSPAPLLEHARGSMAGGQLWSAALVIALTYVIARSTVTVGWVRGIDEITVIAVGAAVLMGLLAVLPIPWPPALAFGTLAGAAASLAATWPWLHRLHPDDAINAKLLSIWLGRINDGSAASDPSFYLVLIAMLMWITGGWLSWCVLRWRKPLLGLIPGAAAFATNLLNAPDNQNFYTLVMLVLTLALLLWSNYTASIASAARAKVKLSGDARWDFWESGLAVMAGLIVISILLPPLSTADRTIDVENSLFSGWAQIQQRINHPGFSGPPGRTATGTTGFATDVKLSGALARNKDVVFIYTTPGSFTGTRYFRGVDATSTSGGEWRYPSGGLNHPLQKNQATVFGEEYHKLANSIVDVNMRKPPAGNGDIIFYPGQLYKLDRATLAVQVPTNSAQNGSLWTIDRLSSIQPNTSAGAYRVTVAQSTASIDDLRAAGTNYKPWLQPYMEPPSANYRDPKVLARIRELARKIVTDANAETPYDQASAVEAYLRSGKFTYTLQPPPTPEGRDPLDYFLFTSYKGYCEFFATAMGDMLRSLKIPTRLVNGYGPGTFDSTVPGFVVRSDDAHTWVEVYFPDYGWIPFEPTKDSEDNYPLIQRGSSGPNPCLRDNACENPTTSGPGGVPNSGPAVGPKNPRGEVDPGSLPGGFRVRIPDAGTLTTVVGVLLALLLLLLAATTRYLRPRTVMGVWSRMHALAHLAGAERRPGETPRELSRRLQKTFPEASESVGSLASGFAVAAYAPPDEAANARSSVMESWSALRPMLIRRVLSRLKPRSLF
jgi:hypothetical protein